MEFKNRILSYETALHYASTQGLYDIVEYHASLKNIDFNITSIWFYLLNRILFYFLSSPKIIFEWNVSFIFFFFTKKKNILIKNKKKKK